MKIKKNHFFGLDQKIIAFFRTPPPYPHWVWGLPCEGLGLRDKLIPRREFRIFWSQSEKNGNLLGEIASNDANRYHQNNFGIVPGNNASWNGTWGIESSMRCIYPPGSKSEALRLGVHLILLNYITPQYLPPPKKWWWVGVGVVRKKKSPYISVKLKNQSFFISKNRFFFLKNKRGRILT